MPFSFRSNSLSHSGVHSKITDQRPQNSYEQLLNQTKCADLACLRQVPEKKLRDASLAINMDTFDYGAPVSRRCRRDAHSMWYDS